MRKIMSLLLAVLQLLTVTAALAEQATPTDAIAEAIAQETRTDYTPDNMIPIEYKTSCKQKGTVEEIHYATKDYFGDGSEYTKRAFVYLPYGYDASLQYKVLILCHGIGGSEYEWGMKEKVSRLCNIMDHLVANGDVEPFIIVTPNGKAGNLSRPGVNKDTAYQSFYLFGQELRNDLLPYLQETYSISPDREDHAMAGLSMGGMQTINIGMCECLDLFAWFGAFSACPTTYTAREIAGKLAQWPEENEVLFFYNICGTEDNIAYASASAAAKNILPLTDRLTEDNYIWQEMSGAHDFGVWYVGFYNFAQIWSPKAE